MEFIRMHQLDAMVFMSGICVVLAFLTLIIETPSSRKKSILTIMELSAMILLIFERYSYIYRGGNGNFAFWMVRFSNGMVFFLQIFILLLVTQYLRALLQEDGGLDRIPFFLKVSEAAFVVGTVLIMFSQFTDFYYVINSNNIYSRSYGFIFAYVIPVFIVIMQVLTIIKYRRLLSKGLCISLLLAITFPTIVSIVQIFFYGLSLTSISTVIVIILFYTYSLKDLNRAVQIARKNELESYKEAEKREAAMFEQTAQALVNAIDTKDKYTHGHSTRVAAISRQLAEESGFSENECKQVYFAALLHDVGKIGVPGHIIKKEGKLTEEEFEYIKQHPIQGYHILSGIKQSPELSIGARYHHERYDGKGYPDGLAGDDIPRIARIIAVADAYDAMSSTRSYRNILSDDVIREELVRGRGTQFDPVFADMMLQLIDEDRLILPNE